jgi:predicted peptidase
MQENEMQFQTRELALGAASYRYLVYAPPNRTPGRQWPVALFLHGAGERGDDNIAQTRLGISRAIRQQHADFSCVLVLPQCPRNRWWPEPEMQAHALKALDQTISEFDGDPARVYLTGMSMGGYGTWAIAAARPEKFAALAPVCGGINPPPFAAALFALPKPPAGLDLYRLVAERVGKTPVWAFHGELDPIVPVAESRKMVAAIRAAGGNVRYTEYRGVGHNSWEWAYREPDFFSWLLSQKRG